MKLLRKYRINTYKSLLAVLVMWSLLNCWLIRYFIYDTTDDVLHEYRIDVERYAAENGRLQSLYFMGDKLSAVRVQETSGTVPGIDESIRDTSIYSHYEKEMVVYRKMDFPVTTARHRYLVTIMLPALEEDDLIAAVLTSMVILILLFILFTTLQDRVFTRKIFRPFQKMLDAMRTYNLEERTSVKLDDTDIDEFRDLNRILTGMMTKISQDYDEIKDFLEYTSHEMKTPLAIIQLKLEDLNQREFEDEKSVETVSSIQSALQRIIRFNRSLLFIAKIKNNQFRETRTERLNRLVLQYIRGYEELLHVRHITCDVVEEGTFRLDIHPLLAEQLVHNIMTNAIVHNRDNGSILVRITPSTMVFTNTFTGKVPTGDLFEKYRHSKQCKDSTGLGLAIVKNICLKYHLEVSYEIRGNQFLLSVARQSPDGRSC